MAGAGMFGASYAFPALLPFACSNYVVWMKTEMLRSVPFFFLCDFATSEKVIQVSPVEGGADQAQ